ncbi:bifunctional DNA primase/polymerase [Blastococcus sp. SYSU DS0510]
MSLLVTAAALRLLPGAEILTARDLGEYAVELAVNGWAVFPLRGKVPAIRGGHGVLDATTNVDQVIRWWTHECSGANIGARVPEQLFVLDVDPRNGGGDSLDQLTAAHGRLPNTRTAMSGRGDGGRHLYFRHPGGRLTSSRLGPGLDIKTSAGYMVMPPSLHPATGQPYRWVNEPFAAAPGWLVELISAQAPAAPQKLRSVAPGQALSALGGSIADRYSASASWADILSPHGWRCLSADPDADGARWQHPIATGPVSATVRHDCLFVYSPNTPFPVTEAGNVRGVTRFRAYAVLQHGGDLSAAARALRTGAAA